MFRSGQQIGIYTLINRLGRGGFGEVWLAEKRSKFVTKRVAIKLPLEEQVDFEAIRQEATLWEQASGHANVLPIIDADIYDGQVVIVSEYAEGGSLADKLRSSGKLPVRQAVEMTIGILKGLEYLHNKRIIHRDIKPANILLQGDTPRLADFGVSRAMQTSGISSKIIGTDAYMSPESFRGLRTVETDIWSVGVVLYQLLNGRLPFPQENPSERMYAILQTEFETMSDDIPQDLRRIVEKALAKLPADRYRSAAQMRDELKSFLISESTPPPIINPVPKPIPKPSVNPAPGPAPKPDETVTQVNSNISLPETRLAEPQDEKTLVAVHLSSPSNSSRSSKKPKRIWLYLSLALIPFVISILAIASNLYKKNSTANTVNTNRSAVPPLTALPTPLPNYDIAEIRADVKEFRLFESGKGDLPIEQRKYGTVFYKHSTRYINYELTLEFPPPENTKYFSLKTNWLKGTNIIHSQMDSHQIERASTNAVITNGYGGESYGMLEAGSYKVEIKYENKVIASKSFNIPVSLTGTWEGADWGTVTISGGDSSYSGSYTVPKGSFTLSKVTDGTYKGMWRNSDSSKWGNIERAIVSADGDTISVTWGYSYPESSRASGKSSKWTRKKTE